MSIQAREVPYDVQTGFDVVKASYFEPSSTHSLTSLSRATISRQPIFKVRRDDACKYLMPLCVAAAEQRDMEYKDTKYKQTMHVKKGQTLIGHLLFW
jgi:hypothetical protein